MVSCPQVVQDFVQQTADEETPTEWLHHIMETNSREEGDYDINLLGLVYIFSERKLYCI